jgi:hypothetical protein
LSAIGAAFGARVLRSRWWSRADAVAADMLPCRYAALTDTNVKEDGMSEEVRADAVAADMLP